MHQEKDDLVPTVGFRIGMIWSRLWASEMHQEKDDLVPTVGFRKGDDLVPTGAPKAY